MIGEPFTLFGHTIRVSLSAGSSIYPEHGSTLHELKVKADMAMYHVKQAGRNGWAIYHPGNGSYRGYTADIFTRIVAKRLNATSLSYGISLNIPLEIIPDRF